MPSNLLKPLWKTLVASTGYTATGATAAFALPDGADTCCILLYTATVTGTTPVCDFVLQSSPDGGTTYINLPIRATQITAAGQIYWVFKQGLGNNEVAFESPAASTGGTLAKNCVFDPAKMKVAYTISGTSPVFTTTIFGGFVPKDASGGR